MNQDDESRRWCEKRLNSFEITIGEWADDIDRWLENNPDDRKLEDRLSKDVMNTKGDQFAQSLTTFYKTSGDQLDEAQIRRLREVRSKLFDRGFVPGFECPPSNNASQ